MARYGQLTDAELVVRARSGSRDAVGELFERHFDRAWRTALAITGSRTAADDVAQDSFERVIRGLPGFDGRRPFAAWLYRIVVNRAKDVVTRRPMHGELASELHTGEVAAGEVDRAFLDVVARLDPERRVCIVLRYGIGMTPAEIAPVVGAPVGTVHSRLARALEQLREEVEEYA